MRLRPSCSRRGHQIRDIASFKSQMAPKKEAFGVMRVSRPGFDGYVFGDLTAPSTKRLKKCNKLAARKVLAGV